MATPATAHSLSQHHMHKPARPALSPTQQATTRHPPALAAPTSTQPAGNVVSATAAATSQPLQCRPPDAGIAPPAACAPCFAGAGVDAASAADTSEPSGSSGTPATHFLTARGARSLYTLPPRRPHVNVSLSNLPPPTPPPTHTHALSADALAAVVAPPLHSTPPPLAAATAALSALGNHSWATLRYM